MNIGELKRLWEENGFRPNKKLGQNFLIDKNIRDKILSFLPVDTKGIVVEIGAGFGVMSFEAADRCGRLYAVEKDKKICGIMEAQFRQKENLELVQGDILDLDICALVQGPEKLTVFGNIPYFITTPVIEKIIKERRCIKSAYIMIQEEFADRVTSSPGTKDYGSISCYVQFYTKVKKLIKIKKNSFYPRPRVDSCLLELAIPQEPRVRVEEEELMFKIIRKAFSQRRKKVVNTLSHGDFLSMERDDWRGILEKCGIDSSLRAENLSLSDYAKLSNTVGDM